ncbi:Chemotaxis protein CheV [Planctomycetes bacterium Pan216]|uniref:Chemotaxis protein CheV n=1 Tax=Kolteria novifilia TaxID=2527975 RepID=A0A518B488_9BACT|nr:Chemotaxis protein CheV [Planctomycetes bacterium Pan216]
MRSFDVKQMLLEKDILLEAGTNELEVLVFSLDGRPYGINVAKVREVISPPTVHRMPSSHESVEGAFRLRDRVIPLINLARFLGMESSVAPKDSRIVVTEFNSVLNSFRVDDVRRIYRVSWDHIEPLPSIPEFSDTPITAVTRIDDVITPMLDFEMIVDRIHAFSGLRPEITPVTDAGHRQGRHIAIAEDSVTVQQLISDTLTTAGYENVVIFNNGLSLWEWLEAQAADGPETLSDRIDVVIADIEMPRMDGLHLTKRVREHPVLGGLPIIIFSSLITPDNLKKGKSVGATMQISKPELFHVVTILDDLLSGRVAEEEARATSSMPARSG